MALGEGLSDGDIGVDGPDGLANIFHEAFRACARRAESVDNEALEVNLAGFEMFRADGPPDDGGRILAGSVIVDIADDADDFAPVVFGADADVFAESGGGAAPEFAGGFGGDDADRNL